MAKIVRLESLVKMVERFEGTLAGLGRKYGIYTEDAFRNAIKFMVEDLIKAWSSNTPPMVEIDVLVGDGEYILVKYKADIDRGDISKLSRLGDL